MTTKAINDCKNRIAIGLYDLFPNGNIHNVTKSTIQNNIISSLSKIQDNKEFNISSTIYNLIDPRNISETIQSLYNYFNQLDKSTVKLIYIYKKNVQKILDKSTDINSTIINLNINYKVPFSFNPTQMNMYLNNTYKNTGLFSDLKPFNDVIPNLSTYTYDWDPVYLKTVTLNDILRKIRNQRTLGGSVHIDLNNETVIDVKQTRENLLTSDNDSYIQETTSILQQYDEVLTDPKIYYKIVANMTGTDINITEQKSCDLMKYYLHKRDRIISDELHKIYKTPKEENNDSLNYGNNVSIPDIHSNIKVLVPDFDCAAKINE